MIILVNNPEVTCRLESLMDAVGPVQLIPKHIDTSPLHWHLARIANVHGATMLRTAYYANTVSPKLTREAFARCA